MKILGRRGWGKTNPKIMNKAYKVFLKSLDSVKVKFGYRQHTGGLEESLKTIEYINLQSFVSLLPEYDFYAYDDRCKQILFILKDIEIKHNCFKTENYEEYLERTWLFIEVC